MTIPDGLNLYIQTTHKALDGLSEEEQIVVDRYKNVLALKAKLVGLDATAFGSKGLSNREDQYAAILTNSPDANVPYVTWTRDCYHIYQAEKINIESGASVDVDAIVWPAKP